MTGVSYELVSMLILVLVGWAFNLGILWQISRNHKDRIETNEDEIAKLKDRMDRHHEASDIHSSSEWRISMCNRLDRMEGKIDDLVSRGKV